jgi:hypothetical protein
MKREGTLRKAGRALADAMEIVRQIHQFTSRIAA